ncbi:MAG TPA: phenylacetic acid degradation protein PaaN [Rhodocyclaceae bacterium]|nr:phenylacetic acid degradation protein PaaN [Rhodocyclaceae bacterium]
MPHPLFEKHQELLKEGIDALQYRGYWCPYADTPAAYGKNAAADGHKALEAYLDAQFYLDQPGVFARGGEEVSPYGLPLNISYPQSSPDALIAAAKLAMPAWVKAGADTRAGVCAEILSRLNVASMEIAHAVMHTTGQSLAMAFLSAGPHAQARGLEAVISAYREMKQVPESAIWEKSQIHHPQIRMEKQFSIVPRGVALVIACSTFPTWNAYPGIFASLVTGNPVIVKAHPRVILPLAISVAVARQALKDAGFDANLISLLIDDRETLVAREIALKPDIRIIDYTGGPAFGEWLEQHARQAVVYAEKSGVNCIVVDSTTDYPGMLHNLAITLSLNSGQMCTTPQTLFVPITGVRTADGVVSTEEFGTQLAAAIGKFLEDSERAIEVLGAIRSPLIDERIDACSDLGTVLRDSVTLIHPQYPKARIRTPLLVKVSIYDHEAWMVEHFGPISFLVETESTSVSLAVVERTMREKGAITFSVYSTDENILQLVDDVSLRNGVSLSLNLTDNIFVNQTAGFSDFQATGANPAANACLTSSAYVAGRFFVVQKRQHIP